jgi:hypothetical protein
VVQCWAHLFHHILQEGRKDHINNDNNGDGVLQFSYSMLQKVNSKNTNVKPMAVTYGSSEAGIWIPTWSEMHCSSSSGFNLTRMPIPLINLTVCHLQKSSYPHKNLV